MSCGASLAPVMITPSQGWRQEDIVQAINITSLDLLLFPDKSPNQLLQTLVLRSRFDCLPWGRRLE